MVEKLVSVVVPVYNVEKYLDRCLESITGQTYKNLEIILVDDGSPDNCPQICEEWKEKDSRIKVIHKENAGLGMARNSGMSLATGKYIFFFDSDDYVDKTIVQKCVESAEANNSDVVIFGHMSVSEDGRHTERKLSQKRLVYKGESVKSKVLPSMFTYTLGFGVSACKMYDLQMLKETGVEFCSERELISEDSVFNLKVFSKVNSVSIVPESLYFYCQRSNSLTHSYNADKPKRNNAYLQTCLEYAKKGNMPEIVKYSIMARYHAFTLGVLRLIENSSLPRKSKNLYIKEILTGSVLRSTLVSQVIKFDAFLPKLFWWALKFKCYFLCRLFVWLKARI